MKRIFIIVLLVSGINGHAQKHKNFQNPEEEKVSFSVKAGWIYSTLKGSDIDFLSSNGKVDNHNNFLIGAGVNNPIGKNFSLKHELFFQTHGSEFPRELDNSEIDAKLKMHSLRLNPISLAYRLGNFNIFTGPYMNILISSSITAIDDNGNIYKDHDIFGTEVDDQDGSHFLQNMDYGVVLGAEYNFDFGGLIGVQYSRGFATIFDNANVYENQGPDGSDDLKIYNQTLSAYLGYIF